MSELLLCFASRLDWQTWGSAPDRGYLVHDPGSGTYNPAFGVVAHEGQFTHYGDPDVNGDRAVIYADPGWYVNLKLIEGIPNGTAAFPVTQIPVFANADVATRDALKSRYGLAADATINVQEDATVRLFTDGAQVRKMGWL